MKRYIRSLLIVFLLFPFFNAQAQIIQVGFSIDASSSTDSEELPVFVQGVADGILLLKTDGTIELTISQFRSAAIVIWGPKIIDSAAVRQKAADRVLVLDPTDSLETNPILGLLDTGTDIEEGFKVTADAMANSPNAGSSVLQFINMLTDGNPTLHSMLDFSDIDETVRKQRAKQFALIERNRIIGIGIDVISFEALGSGPDEIAFLETLAYPEPGVVLAADSTKDDFPNPITDKGFILNVANIQGIKAALEAKFEAAGFIDNQVPDPLYTPEDDTAKITYDGPLTPIKVLVNDIVDPPNAKDQLRIFSVSEPGQPGAMTGFNADKDEVYYQPPPGFMGMDSFTYSVKAGSSDPKTAMVEVEVLKGWEPPTDISASNWSMRNLALATAEGAKYIALYDQYSIELFYILFRALTGNQADVVNQSDSSDTDPSSPARGTEESEMAVINLLTDAQAGFSALLTGQGETEMISQDMVDDLKSIHALVLAEASPQLNADAQAIADKHNGFDNFVGKNFNEWAVMIGFDPEAITIQNVESGLNDGKFSITTYNAPNVIYKLWKSTDLGVDSWLEVSNAEIVEDGNLVTLSDLNPVVNRTFYRVTNQLE